MALGVGSQFGSYEILSVIGEGGMGRVYRARDLKLQRVVAVKVLPEGVAGDPERIARFEREARTLATLNHPHIAQIYGLEDTGSGHALLMECVEGEDLGQRLARGPIPWHDAMPIARQIAEALEAAHERGIVHRDLKPANIKVTADGVVKVLDFGLAKAAGEAGPADATDQPHLANSPTITTPAAMTQAGMILGTAAYMSPEQAKGRPADKRSDVWAFGCVLYEMLTSKRAFPGDDVMETLAAVVRADPNLSVLPRDVPPHVHALIEQCLVKDRRERVSDIAAARYALRLSDGPSLTPVATTASRVAWAVAGVATVFALAAVGLPRLLSRPANPQPVIRSLIPAPDVYTGGFATVVISRQGTHIAYASAEGLMVRRLSEAAARMVQGGADAANPFFSYDGESIGFFADGKLKKVSLSGGAAQVLADAPSGRGGTWSADGTIVFAPTSTSGLYSVSANSGDVTQITKLKPDERSHRWPHLLPGGRTVLFTLLPAGKNYDDAIIASVPVSGGEPQTIIEGGSFPQFAEPGQLLFGRAGTLLSSPFDLNTGRTNGDAIAVIENVRTNLLNGAVPVAVSTGGTLVYIPGASRASTRSMLSVTRSGQTDVLFDRRLISTFRLSPDGQRVAVSINDGQEDIWLLDLKQRALSRFTFGTATETSPVWTPDGQRLFYASNSPGTAGLMTKLVDGREEAKVTLSGSGGFYPTTITPDGRVLLGRGISTLSFDVMALPLGGGEPSPVLAAGANESEAALSPDGRYLAFQSDETGRPEILVQAYPSGGRWQVTTGGGSEPHWTSGGRELVYRNGPTVVAVPITLQPFAAGQPQTLFGVPNLFAFDVAADGKRFIVATSAESTENTSFVLVTGWFEELKAKMRSSR